MANIIIKAIKNPKKALWAIFSKAYNPIAKLRVDDSYKASELKELDEIKEHCIKRTDISDHLLALFTESFSMKPKLIVELGVRGGESTFVFERVAKLCSSKLVSVDIQDCESASKYKNWMFVKMDDIQFAKEFKSWCKKKKIRPEIDILFIDTSHLYEHTVQEINSWFPLLSKKCRVFFHDTNLQDVYFRKDDTVGFGWNNKRGVIRAVEDYFDVAFDEERDFVDYRKGWLIKHNSKCNGFTVLERIS